MKWYSSDTVGAVVVGVVVVVAALHGGQGKEEREGREKRDSEEGVREESWNRVADWLRPSLELAHKLVVCDVVCACSASTFSNYCVGV